MRRLIGALVVVVILVAGLAVVDVVARHRVQAAAATHIEDRLPGSAAVVRITSFPFLGRLAVSGDVPLLTARITGFSTAGFSFSLVTVVVHHLSIDTSQLVHRRLVIRSISSGLITADLTQASVDHAVGLPVAIGAGTIGLGGTKVPAAVSVSGTKLSVTLPVVGSISITVPALSVLPCIGQAVLVPGALQLSCAISQLPPIFGDLNASF